MGELSAEQLASAECTRPSQSATNYRPNHATLRTHGNSEIVVFDRLTVCVTRKWAGVDHAWEQKKLEARKILENAAESHTSGARFVRLRFIFDTDLIA